MIQMLSTSWCVNPDKKEVSELLVDLGTFISEWESEIKRVLRKQT